MRGVFFSFAVRSSIGIAFSLCCATLAGAASGTWNNTTSGGLWATTTNWSGGTVANGADANADFSTLNITADNTVHLDSARTIGNLLFGDTTASNNWILDNNGNAANVLTLNVSTGTPTITVNNQTATISAVLAGSQGFTKIGVGTLTFSGASANTYSGTTTVNAGTLILSKTATLNAVPGNLVIGDGLGGVNADVVQSGANNQIGDTATVTVNSSGLLNIGSFQDYVPMLILNGGAVSTGTGPSQFLGFIMNSGQVQTNASSQTATIAGVLNLNDDSSHRTTFSVASGTTPSGIDLDISAQAVAGGIIKNGAGAMRLSNSTSNFANATLLNAGTILIAADSTGGQGSVTAGPLGTSALIMADQTVIKADGAAHTIANNINVSGTVFVDGSQNLTLNGNISGAGNITKNGTGTLTVNAGPATNGLTGTWTVNSGILQLSQFNGAAAVGGNGLTIGDGVGGANADIVRLLSSGPISMFMPVNINSSGLLDLNGATAEPGQITLAGGAITTGTGTLLTGSNTLLSQASSSTATISGKFDLFTATQTFNIAQGTTSSGIDLDISAAVSDGSISKSGAGAMRLSGNSTVGAISVSSGQLIVGNSGATVSASGNISVDQATLSIQGVGSAITQTGSASVTVDQTSQSTAALNIGTTTAGGSLTTGSGGITINRMGIVTVGSGGLTSQGPALVDGGKLNVNGGFGLGAGNTLTVRNGGEYTNSLPGLIAFLSSGSAYTVQSGGQISFTAGSGAGLDIGSSAQSPSYGNVTVDGSGSSISAATGYAIGLGSGSFVLQNGAIGSIAGFSVSSSGMVADGTIANAVATIQSGAMLTTDSVHVASSATSGATSLTVDGPGSALTIRDGGSLTIGSASGAANSVTASNGAALTVGTGGTTLNSNGVLNISGGVVDLKTFSDNGGTLNFNSGSLSYIGNLTVGAGGILGTDLTLAGNRSLSLSGTTTISSFHTLALSGGTLNTGSLVANGTFSFQSGTLGITGSSGLTIGAGGPFGSTFTLSSGCNLNVTNTATINSGSLFEVESGANVFAGTLANSGEVLLDGSTATLSATTLNNSGLLHGTGHVAAGVVNSASGQVRAEGGQRLHFTGATFSNLGSVQVLGDSANPAEIEFDSAVTNSASTGIITGHNATLFFNAGLTNQGSLALTSGGGDVFGKINNTGSMVVSGGAGVTFYDDVVQNGTLRVSKVGSTDSSAVFFGAFSGSGGSSGGGDIFFEGDLRPGNSPASVTMVNNVSLGSASQLQIEIGGTTAGAQFDQVHVVGQLSLDGALQASLINGFLPRAGNAFDILDWSTLSGVFSTIQLPTLGGRIAWDSSQLYSTGTLSVLATYYAGDINRDGVVTVADISALMNALSNVSGYQAAHPDLADPQHLLDVADVNGDGLINNADIQALISLVANNVTTGNGIGNGEGSGTVSTVPEPASAILLFVGSAVALGGWRVRRRQNRGRRIDD